MPRTNKIKKLVELTKIIEQHHEEVDKIMDSLKPDGYPYMSKEKFKDWLSEFHKKYREEWHKSSGEPSHKTSWIETNLTLMMRSVILNAEKEGSLDNESVTITKDGLTKDKSGIILKFDKTCNKFQVDFGNGFVGWYHRGEFKVDK